MVAIFDLTIGQVVALWWMSTSMIFHLNGPTNSVESARQLQDYGNA